MRRVAAIFAVALALIETASAGGDGYPRPPAPEWVPVNDRGLERLFLKTIGDRPARVKWNEAQFQRSDASPMETVRISGLVMSVGEQVIPRVTRACISYFYDVPNDERHWLPEDPHHWERAEQFPVWRCFVVDPPKDPGGVTRFPDLIRRVYGGPIFVKGKVSAFEIEQIVDRFWREVIAQCSSPEAYEHSGAQIAVNKDGAPMWQEFDGISVQVKNGRRFATLHLQIGMDDDTEGFPFWLEKTSQGWEPVDGFASFLDPY